MRACPGRSACSPCAIPRSRRPPSWPGSPTMGAGAGRSSGRGGLPASHRHPRGPRGSGDAPGAPEPTCGSRPSRRSAASATRPRFERWRAPRGWRGAPAGLREAADRAPGRAGVRRTSRSVPASPGVRRPRPAHRPLPAAGPAADDRRRARAPDRHDYSIPLSERVGFALRAGRAEWTVFVNGEVTRGRWRVRPLLAHLRTAVDHRTPRPGRRRGRRPRRCSTSCSPIQSRRGLASWSCEPTGSLPTPAS